MAQAGKRYGGVVRARRVDGQRSQAISAFQRPLPHIDVLDAAKRDDRIGTEENAANHPQSFLRQ